MTQPLRKMVLAGGSGFLGRLLADWFRPLNWDVVVLTREPCAAMPARAVLWDGETGGDWAGELEGATALVNLAGRSVNCRYHAQNRRAIVRSRLDSTRALGEAVAGCMRPPKVWLNSSTATIYKHSFDRPMDEASGLIAGTPEAKDVFSVEVAKAWEAAFAEAAAPATRKVALRTAMVLSTYPHTVYRVLRRLVRSGLGGAMGGGRQFVSWLHQTDFCRAVEWVIEHDELAGPVNLAAPEPLPNRDVMSTLRVVCHVPFGLPATRWMLEIGAVALRTETELIINSRRVVPARLLEAGFQFRFPDFRSAVEDLERRMAQPPRRSLRVDSRGEGGDQKQLTRSPIND
jgi:hypothetical protein